MRTYLALTCAILVAGYGVSAQTISNLREGDDLVTAVTTFTDEIEKCYLETPENTTVHFKPEDLSDDKYELLEDSPLVSQCRVQILNMRVSDSGLWTLNAVNSNGETMSQSYDVTVQEREELVPEYLEEQRITTTLNSIHYFSISEAGSYVSETCGIITPDGKTLNLKEENIDGVELHTTSNFGCGVKITVLSENFVGNWTLVARGTRFVTEVERRLPFVVSVEESVKASPSHITVGEYNNMHLSLANPISDPETCRLITPLGYEYLDNAETRSNTCTFVVIGVNAQDNGTWTIVYGNRIIYRAPVEVVVVVRPETEDDLNLHWILHSSVQQVIGPEDAIYCKLSDPNGVTVFEGFGRCNITVDRVGVEHEGQWRMAVGLHGHVLTEVTTFNVRVTEPYHKPAVITHVEATKPTLTISCSLENSEQLQACTFREPSGKLLLAHQGVSQGRYSSHGSSISYETSTTKQSCGLNITDPTLEDVGFWRCGLQTSEDVHYGHLRVTVPWLLRDPEDAAMIVTEPTLKASVPSITMLEGEAVTMSCSIPADIRYCYFRHRNGTIFHVEQDDPKYVGLGFEAGECGIRFPSLSKSDSGAWSCHVASKHAREPEQRASFDVTILQALSARLVDRGDSLTIKVHLNHRATLTDCLFVRIDGLGFTIANAPDGYNLRLDGEGSCVMEVFQPTMLDRHPWTVVGQLLHQGSIVKVTTMSVPDNATRYTFRFPTIWLVVMIVGLSMAMVAAILSPSKNRRWVAERASSVRNSVRDSFRRSFKKPTMNDQNIQNIPPPVAA